MPAKKAAKKALLKSATPVAEAPGEPAAPRTTEVKLGAAKGRPMLQWVGKKPLSRVTAFPAQLVETFDPAGQTAAHDPSKSGQLFHGDNKEVLAHLLANGYRGKVDLIYIDPPFDSAADYVRKVTLRGKSALAKIEGETYSLGEQVQYTDIWANDNYLQFMFERLILLKELLANSGVLVLHCDWRKTHHLRCLLDEVFGPESFQNEVHWYFYNKMHDDRKGILPRATNTLLVYAKGEQYTFNRVAVPRPEVVKQLKRVKVEGVLVNLRDDGGNLVYQDSDARTLDNVWPIPLIPPADVKQKTDYPTQKPQALLDLVLRIYSQPNSLVLDAFIGSGTTVVSAQHCGRRWIGCDINKGAIQTTSKRLQGIIRDQLAAKQKAEENAKGDLFGGAGKAEDSSQPAALSFQVHRVNDYDLAIQHNEAVALACEHIGVTRTKTDAYFDGTQGKRLVKIIPFNHPLSPADLEQLKGELAARANEERDILLVCLGKELACETWLTEWGRLRKRGDVPNKVEVIELRTDPKYGKFMTHTAASAKVSVKRKKHELHITIEDFSSPAIIERLDSQDSRLFKAQVTDWRFMVDSVMIDTAYDGQVFRIALTDLPEKKADLVSGTYILPAPGGETTVAVKITDMLGEEAVVSTRV
jgi:DNA modification methylase